MELDHVEPGERQHTVEEGIVRVDEQADLGDRLRHRPHQSGDLFRRHRARRGRIEYEPHQPGTGADRRVDGLFGR